MAGEASIQCNLQLTKGNLKFTSPLSQYRADVNGTNGPTPGGITVPTTGVTISLAQLTALGGLCVLTNYDSTNFVRYGIMTPGGYVPFGRLRAGEQVTLRLDDELLTGPTGTAHVNNLYMIADTAPCNCYVGAFDP